MLKSNSIFPGLKPYVVQVLVLQGSDVLSIEQRVDDFLI